MLSSSPPVGGAAFDAEEKSANDAAMVLFQKMLPKLLIRCPWNGSTWATAKKTNGIFQMGCMPCSMAGSTCTFGSFSHVTPNTMQLHILERHQLNRGHQKATKTDKDSGAIGAPGSDEMLQVLKHPEKHSDSIGRGKHDAMRWCLSEARKDILRADVKSAASTSVSQDPSLY